MSIRNADGRSPFSPNDSKSDGTPKSLEPTEPFLDELFGKGFTGTNTGEKHPEGDPDGIHSN